MSNDESSRFDAVEALLKTDALNADKTRRISVLQAVVEGQVQRALAGDSRAAASILSLADRCGLFGVLSIFER